MTEEVIFYNNFEEEDKRDEEEEIKISFSTSPTIPINPKYEDFLSVLTKFRTFVPDIEIPESFSNELKFSISSSLLPLTLRVAFGFLDSDVLLDIDLELDDFEWNRTPNICKISNPMNNNYSGKALVEDAKDRFFNPDYKPKTSYRSAAIFIRAQRDSDIGVVRTLESLGYSHMQSVRASSLCYNDLDKSVTFLQTGQYQLESTFTLPLSYLECPLLFFVLEIVDAILDLQDHCAMCGEKTTAGLRANVCNKDKCLYRFIELGVGMTLSKEIARDPCVADLLFSVFSVTHNTIYFNPKPKKTKTPLETIINKMPSMESLSKKDDDSCLTQCIGQESSDILRWVILTCRSNFLLLPRELEFPQFRSSTKEQCFQFMALTGSPEQENIFQQLKKKYGSCFLWHGSPTERWHAIIRQGLKNLSNTPLMGVGAACGEGIYFAPDSGTSLDYSRGSPNLYPKSKLGENLQIIALCEVIKLPFGKEVIFNAEINGEDPKTKKIKTVRGTLNNHTWCYTLTMNEACVVRFVFVNLKARVNVLSNPPNNIPTLNKVLRLRAKI